MERAKSSFLFYFVFEIKNHENKNGNRTVFRFEYIIINKNKMFRM